MKDYSGEAFLNKIYKDLYMSEVVMHTANPSDKPSEKISKYMERLERVHSNKSNNIKNYVTNLYHKKYIIKEENLSSYLSKEQKKQIIDAQIKSLDMWIDYLTDENAKYPMWAKYWAFQGMLKIGTYDEATDTYKKRTEKTTNPFIETNPEVIAKCIDLIVKQVNKPLSEINVGEEGLKKLLESGSFQKLYPMFLKSQKQNQYKKSGFEGKWIKYNYGSKEDAIKLYDSLQGYGTAWCTAASENTAIDQVCGGNGYVGGDFYVYYTLDEKNEYKIPRIAIRMDGTTEIGEIRGVVDASQNLEDGLEDIVESKLNSFVFLSDKDREEHMIAVNDSKMLTQLNRKTAKKEELTIEEERFIYEFNRNVVCFGWEQDSRIQMIKQANPIKHYETAIEAVTRNGNALEYVSSELKSNIEVVKAAVTQNGNALIHASSELKSNIEVVKAAVTQNGRALIFAYPELKNNIEIVKAAVTQNGHALYYASPELKNYLELVNIALNDAKFLSDIIYRVSIWAKELEDRKIDFADFLESFEEWGGWLLKVFNAEQKDDEQIVASAVKKCGYALEYASPRLQNDSYLQKIARESIERIEKVVQNKEQGKSK